MDTPEDDPVLGAFIDLAFNLVDSEGFDACDGDGERLVLNNSKALRFEIGCDSKLCVFVEIFVDCDGGGYGCWTVDWSWSWDLNDPEIIGRFIEFVVASGHL